jgi:hypothetical protein
VKHHVEVTKQRTPTEDPPPAHQDADLWFQTEYRFACADRTYYAWSYETKPGTVNMTSWEEAGKLHAIPYVPYQDRTFCRVARYVMSMMGAELIVWCEHQPIRVEAQRLKH